MKQSRVLLAVIFPFLGLALLLSAARLQAVSPLSGEAIFIVNSTLDAIDVNPGDGVCETAVGNGICTLRAAIMEGNFLPDADIIQLQSGIYTLTIPGADENDSLSGDLDILAPVTLIGTGSETTIIDGNSLDRVFHITGQISPLITLSELTIQNGFLADVGITNGDLAYSGGGIFNEAGRLTLDSVWIVENSAEHGGGIYNQGLLTITRSTISDNEATGDPFGHGICGGGICNEDGRLFIADSVLNNNQASGLGQAVGGALYSSGFAKISHSEIISNHGSTWGAGVYNRGILEITESLFSHNYQDSPFFGSAIASVESLTLTKSLVINNGLWPGPAIDLIGHAIIQDSAVVQNQGGGIFADSGTFKIINSTIGENSAQYFGGISFNSATVWLTNTTIFGNISPLGGIYDSPSYTGSLHINNSIVAFNSDENCVGGDDITSWGHNIDSGVSCGFAGPGDQVNTDPLLGPLHNNGGNTLTYALLIGSPAIDMADDNSCPSTDQRGFHRPLGLACDIGAYELLIPTDFIYLPVVLKT